jgi:hypothetical protein
MLQLGAMARRHKENIPNLQKYSLLSTREIKVKITYVHFCNVILLFHKLRYQEAGY